MGYLLAGKGHSEIPPMDKYETRRLALVALREKLGKGGIAKIAAAIGKDPNYVSRMLYPPGKDHRKRIGEDSAELLDAAFPGWLEGTPKLPDRIEGFNRVTPGNTVVTIRQYDTGGKMGNGGVELRDQPGVIESWTVSREWVDQNLRGVTSVSNLFIVTGFGDSMRPMFNPGDPLIVDASVKTVDYDGVYFFRVGDEGFIKRLQRIPGKGLLAISENRAYKEWVIDKTMDFEVFGRVLKVWRSEEF